MRVLPSVSVVIPCYNHAMYVGQALRSVLDQSIRPSEVIIVDDGSTDQSFSVVEQFAQQDDIVRISRNDRNRGVVFSLNRGIDLAKSEYIHFAAADDLLLPGFFEQALPLLARHPEAGLLMSDFCTLDASGRLTPKHLGFAERPSCLEPSEVVTAFRQSGNPIAGCGTLVRREALLEIGGFDAELRWHCDWFTVVVTALRHGLCYVPEPLAAVRFSPGSYSGGALRDQLAQREVIAGILERLHSQRFADVAPRIYQSGVLDTFGFPMVRTVLSSARFRRVLSRVGFRRVLAREFKNLVIRLGPVGLRRWFWAQRYARTRVRRPTSG